MITRPTAAFVAASLLAVQCAPFAAHADNQMGYRLLSSEEAAGLPHNHGALGLDVERAQQITDGGLTFDIMRVKQVHRNSPGERAGFKPGDQIIAVDGHVFPTIAAFAAYVGSTQPNQQVTIDYIPAGGGSQQAERVSVLIGSAAQVAGKSAGLSTGTKVAIGAGAVALLGCYEMGCFSHRSGTAAANGSAR